MRIEWADGLRVVLSERNLKALLTKLSTPDSARTIYQDFVGDTALGPIMVRVFVSAEPDDQHYVDRAPGAMHPQTEEDLRNLRP